MQCNILGLTRDRCGEGSCPAYSQYKHKQHFNQQQQQRKEANLPWIANAICVHNPSTLYAGPPAVDLRTQPIVVSYEATCPIWWPVSKLVVLNIDQLLIWQHLTQHTPTPLALAQRLHCRTYTGASAVQNTE